MPQFLPPHLQKYVVDQNYNKYTPVDQACWRYILRQLKSFLSIHAHECYLEGLEKTGIDVETIPKIEEISQKLEKFGWRALPVSGFIPPAAFMELQSLSVLPIASDMRSIQHLMYTPAPDIVHEAAGHAPILVHPEFAAYLKQYSQVAKKAIISKEDLDLYEAIRNLSDIKENPSSTTEDIQKAERHLEKVSKSMSHVSEAAELSRMNWWTAEYGLIGDISRPKIFGAGLLSSVGESKWCLSDKVKKIPLTVDCIKQTYDITEPQPQLFVTPDFKTLQSVLDEMAGQMAFRRGGAYGLDKAIQAQTVNTIELNTGLQISGQVQSYKKHGSEIIFFKTSGPTQLCFGDKELPGHGKSYHAHGFSSVMGPVLELAGKSLDQLSSTQVEELSNGKTVHWHFASGVELKGKIKSKLIHQSKLLILSFEACQVTLGTETLFAPDWGVYDLAVGSQVVSVFGGPADRIAYGDMDDFVAKRVPAPNYSPTELKLFSIYADIRTARESGSAHLESLSQLWQRLSEFPQEWLPRLELLELCWKDSSLRESPLTQVLQKELDLASKQDSPQSESIRDGLRLLDFA